MPIRNVFISHYSKDDEHISGLSTILEGKGYSIRNSSIDSSKPNQANNHEYVKSLLRPRIAWAGTCIVLIGPNTHSRPWVNWEIEHAARLGKRIVGIYTSGSSGSKIPEALERFGSACVGWRTERMIGAIEGTINDWENEDGTSRPDRGVVIRSEC